MTDTSLLFIETVAVDCPLACDFTYLCPGLQYHRRPFPAKQAFSPIRQQSVAPMTVVPLLYGEHILPSMVVL